MDRLLGSGTVLGMVTNALSQFQLINEIVGIFAGLVTIGCAITLLVIKLKDRKKNG